MTVDIDSIAFAPNAEVGRPRNSEDDGDSTLGGDFLAARGGSRSESHSDEEDGRGFRMTFAQKPGRRRVDWAEEEEHEYRRSSTVRPGRSRSRESGDSAERQPLWDSRSDKSGGSYSSIEEVSFVFYYPAVISELTYVYAESAKARAGMSGSVDVPV